MRRASYEEIVKWVSNSWKSVKISTIISGFQESGIVKESENAISSDFETESMDEFLSSHFCSDSEGSQFDGFEV